jgi:hypothetical protein
MTLRAKTQAKVKVSVRVGRRTWPVVRPLCTGVTSLITSSSARTNQNHGQEDPVYRQLHDGRRDLGQGQLRVCGAGHTPDNTAEGVH